VGRYGVHRRILFGVAAWLLGAATATAGSLLAVSLLGQGITGSSGQLLTQDAVTRALASEAAEAPPSAAARDTGSPAAPARTAPAASATASATDVPATGQSANTTTASPPGDGTVLTSAGGEVVASCQAAGAYLISWSPLQGYEANNVNRGPAAAARVTFQSTTQRVTMVVSCSAGVPSATSYSGRADE
jgi:serine/threonine-protein kinase